MIHEVQVEATFPDGTKLVGSSISNPSMLHHDMHVFQITIHTPVCREDGDLQLALCGSFLPVPNLGIFDQSGEIVRFIINFLIMS
jgi:urease